MNTKLLRKDRFFIGSLIFGLFFGAGNLIFPIQMGQEAGANVLSANLGFLITGIGLPFLGLLSFGVSRSPNLFSLASKVGEGYAKYFTSILYLIIGPIFAMPRLASTSFEIAFSTFIPKNLHTISLLLFSTLFFCTVYFFSRKPSRILDYIGKFLTPLFLVLLFMILGMAFINPLGSIQDAAVQSAYTEGAFLKGFQEGYNTLDALAALAFGMLIIENIQNFGITEPKHIAKETIKSGALGIILMGVIYTLLALLGTMSLGTLNLNKNGGITLAQVGEHYFGVTGSILLAAIVIVACLKTAIGLATSFGRTFSELYPSKSYTFFTVGCIFLSAVIANVGLNQIIAISLPVLMFIYPLAMTLIILGILDPFIGDKQWIYKTTTYFTMFASFFDALNYLPGNLKELPVIESLLKVANSYLPFFEMGMSWLVISFIGFIVGVLISYMNKKKRS
ncbi:branched-chain amino acid transport system II carrier protein [Vagococcus fluvialis]|uniref:branched-chain amino acid transport system II carrier protein n=1 Tax=Vagococcus fluvialis TaxID=2738 RepID=UPI003B5B680F